jgi:hypothetical protein
MTRKALTTVLASLGVFAITLALSAPNASGQSFSNAFTGVTPPPPPPLGPPCLGAPFSIDGDIFDPGSPYSVPMGPPGCGLGWPITGGPYNVDAFSTGLSPAVGVPFPYLPGAFSLLFATDDFVTGDSFAACIPGAPGPFAMTDVGAEASDILVGGTTDVGADVFVTAPNGAPWAVPGAPAPGSAPNFQAFDGDGLPSILFGLPVGPALGLAEPGPFLDSIDAVDAAPIAAWDFIGADAVPDIPVYFSVDIPTAGTIGALPSDIFVAFGGAFGLYAPAGALAMGPGDDVDALIVLDLFADGIYAPPGDVILYSVAVGSFAIGMPDCAGLPIQEGDILTEGTPFGFPGVPCIVIHEEDVGLWGARFCGPNPFSGASDDLDGADLVFPALPPPTTTTSTTTTSTTTTTAGATTTTTAGATTTTTAGATTTTTAGATTTTTAGATTTTTAGATTTTTTTTTSTTTTLPPPLCGGAPLGGCKGALSGKSKFQIKLKVDPSKNQLKLKYNKGAASVLTEFGDPVGGSPQYSLCVWDGSVSPQPLLELQIGPGGICNGKPCWKTKTGLSHQYKNKGGNGDGVEQVKIKADGAPDKTQIQVKAKGLSFTPPALPLTTTVTAQFIVDDGGISCWEVPMSTTIKNDVVQFKAKGD